MDVGALVLGSSPGTIVSKSEMVWFSLSTTALPKSPEVLKYHI